MTGRFRPFHGLFLCGALAAFAACAPTPPAAPSPPAAAPASAAAEGTFQFAPKLIWNSRSSDLSRTVVDVILANPDDVRALTQPEMTQDRWRSFLTVRVVRKDSPGPGELPPLLGTYRVADGMLRFEPRFPLEPGLPYRAEFDPVRLHEVARSLSPGQGKEGPSAPAAARLTTDFMTPPRPMQPSTSVTAVFPSRSTLPENLLRFYIHFSAPMGRGEAYGHIRLLDAAGKPVADPFLELDEELWSGDGKRFTLLFDPGRIKRGLKPREEVGPVLEAGKSYELVVDDGWTDAAGQTLQAGFHKAFRAGPPDETSPDPKTWSVHPPAPETRDPLDVRFPEPLDRALLDRLIAVRDGGDRVVRGTVAVADEETAWRFIPAVSWRPGEYRLVIGTDLEDAAGNSIARPFEVDAVGPITRRVTTETVALPFRIGPALR